MATAAARGSHVQITINARLAAIAWLNAFQATSKEMTRPLIRQTLSLEVFPAGVQFVATNGHILFRSWVPSQTATWPAESRRPKRQFTVMDPDGFGVGFLRALLALTTKEEHQHESLIISSSEADDEIEPSFGSEFQTERVTLRACGQRLDLMVRDEPYPDWRHLRLGMDDLAFVDGMSVSPKYLSTIGKLKDVLSVELTFTGENCAILLNAAGFEGSGTRGLLMPMRRLDLHQKEINALDAEDGEAET
jgi:hypothetical protein